MKHKEVTVLQNFLIAKGYLKSKATGYFGPATEVAVKAFQIKNKITPATGIVGPKTRVIITSPVDTATAPTITPTSPTTNPGLTYTITLVLSKGMTHKEVAVLQNFLIAKGYLTSKATGYFGPSTEAAVKAFQRANKITPVTGIVGPKTKVFVR